MTWPFKRRAEAAMRERDEAEAAYWVQRGQWYADMSRKGFTLWTDRAPPSNSGGVVEIIRPEWTDAAVLWPDGNSPAMNVADLWWRPLSAAAPASERGA